MSDAPKINNAIFPFLETIREHNTRAFFATVKPLYQEILESVQLFCQTLIDELAQDDPTLKGVSYKECLFRIYRDARRLKEGDPLYKRNLAFAISAHGKKGTGAFYYLHLQAGESFLGGGVYRPSPVELRNLRKFLSNNGKTYYHLVENPEFVKTFGAVTGQASSKLPQGFGPATKFPELVTKKQHLVNKHYTDKEVTSPDFFEKVLKDCLVVMPFFEFLNKGCEG